MTRFPFVVASAFLCLAFPLRAEQVIKTIADAPGEALAVNQTSMEAYVANAAGGFLSVVDQLGSVSRITVGANPRYIGLADHIYVSNAGDGTVSIIAPGSTHASFVAIGGAGPIVVDALHDKAYVVRAEHADLAVVDGATLGTHPIDTGGRATTGMAIEPNGRLYVAQGANGNVRAIDVSVDSANPPSFDIPVPGNPGPIAFDIGTRKAYVLTGDAARPLMEIDAATNATRALSLAGHGGSPRAIAAVGERIFMGFATEFVILDLDTGNVRAYPSGPIASIFPESTSGNVYALDTSGRLIVYNRFQQQVTMTAVPKPAYQAAFIYKTNTAFVTGDAGLTLLDSPSADIQVSIDAQGLWWVPNGAESGWGLNLVLQGEIVFGTWFTYDAQGQATWLVMSDGEWSSVRNRYTGTLYRTSGPPFNATPFDPSRVTRTPAGSLTIDLSDWDNAQLTATVDGATITKPLGKQIFAAPETTCSETSNPSGTSIPNYSDLWWAAPAQSESGWGLNIAHQGDILFITWFTYDGNGKPMWIVGSDIEKTGNGTYAGTLYRTTGPPITASPWNPAQVTRTPVGNATLSFTNDSNGTFSYTLDGLTQSKAITRQVYATPVTRCH